MSTMLLWSKAELAIPLPIDKYEAAGFGPRLEQLRAENAARKKAAKKIAPPTQLDIFALLKRPLVAIRKSWDAWQDSRVLDWEDDKSFKLSVTVLQRPSTEVDPAALAGFDWSNEEIRALHSNLFIESMEALKAEDNPEEKLDVLDWVFSPMYIEKLGNTYDGRPCLIRRRAQDIPFSFWNCCLAAGIQDPDDFREKLVGHINGDLRRQLEKYLVSFTGKV